MRKQLQNLLKTVPLKLNAVVLEFVFLYNRLYENILPIQFD